MHDLLAAFGIDWRLLVVNFINFGLLLAVLWYFLYGPIMRMLDARRERIAEGIRRAQEAEDRLREIEETRASTLAAAGKTADDIVSQARAAGSSKERELVAQGEAAAANLLKDAERQAGEMKVQAIAESKQEVAKLIVLGMEKLAVTKK